VTFIQPQALDFLPHPFFIATEGIGDARLIDELLQFRGITNCSVGCPSRISSKGKTGKDAFPDYFAAIQTARRRVDSTQLLGLLVVADADANAGEAFGAIRTGLDQAAFPAPDKPFSIEGNPFRTAVYLLPGEGKTGTLEHLLLDAAFVKAPSLQDCLDDFSTCTGALRSSKPNKLAKMRMSALAAAFCEDNPWCSAHTMWSDDKNPVPIDSPCFNHIGDFVTRFAS
jgi:hypothetical protein